VFPLSVRQPSPEIFAFSHFHFRQNIHQFSFLVRRTAEQEQHILWLRPIKSHLLAQKKDSMIVGNNKALSALLLLAASASSTQAFVPSASASASAAVSSGVRQTQLFSTIEKVKVSPPPTVTGDNAADLFEAHVQKTYG